MGPSLSAARPVRGAEGLESVQDGAQDREAVGAEPIRLFRLALGHVRLAESLTGGVRGEQPEKQPDQGAARGGAGEGPQGEAGRSPPRA
ncbi:hypothetical protein ACFVXC_17500 [Streptomyces sp. NPDC058257]|uniref:hypothetical protein n=1 Tax=Streptomyces sp. NPDC058257 TaxID=3346409 RepID=UPI0036F12DA0